MEYKIINPKTGRKVSIYSKLGIKLLKKYNIEQLGGDKCSCCPLEQMGGAKYCKLNKTRCVKTDKIEENNSEDCFVKPSTGRCNKKKKKGHGKDVSPEIQHVGITEPDELPIQAHVAGPDVRTPPRGMNDHDKQIWNNIHVHNIGLTFEESKETSIHGVQRIYLTEQDEEYYVIESDPEYKYPFYSTVVNKIPENCLSGECHYKAIGKWWGYDYGDSLFEDVNRNQRLRDEGNRTRPNHLMGKRGIEITDQEYILHKRKQLAKKRLKKVANAIKAANRFPKYKAAPKRMATFHNISDDVESLDTEEARDEFTNNYIHEKDLQSGDVIYVGAPINYESRPEYGFGLVNRNNQFEGGEYVYSSGYRGIIDQAQDLGLLPTVDYTEALDQMKVFCKGWCDHTY